MQNTSELVTAIASFRFDSNSPESKTGLVVLYTQVFGVPFDIGCGACYNDAWQKLLKWKRNALNGNVEIKKQFMIETKYQFKKGYPKGGKVTIRANGSLVLVTAENLNDFLGELLLGSPYAHMIEVVEATEKKSSEGGLKLKPVVSTLTEQSKGGSEQSANVKAQELKLKDIQPLKVQTQKVEPSAAKEATFPQLKKRGRKPKNIA